jgi:ankyrin repeat protein
VCNLQTLFTPVHWLSRHGDSEIITLFIEKYGCHITVPDKQGLYPIDYAGLFHHHEAAAILIRHSIKLFKAEVEEVRANPGVKELITEGKKIISDDIFKHWQKFVASS